MLARLARFHQLSQNIERLEREIQDSNAQSPEILLDSSAPLMTAVMDTLLRAAKTPASILILGESGTGKSVVARAIHQRSHLADRPFTTVSCPSLSKELLESELFGHVKGAVTCLDLLPPSSVVHSSQIPEDMLLILASLSRRISTASCHLNSLPPPCYPPIFVTSPARWKISMADCKRAGEGGANSLKRGL